MLVLSDNGAVYIFNIADGDVRGRIEVEKSCLGLEIDPSGLYFAVRTLNETIQMFEVGTGRRVYDFFPEFQ